MRIALLGDVSLTGMFDLYQTEEVYSRIQLIKQLVADCDYVICNLESPLTNITNTLMCKGAYLRSNPCNVKVLDSIGVTHVTLANNHIFDYGKQGAKDTIKALDSHNIDYCGLCNDPILLVKGNDRVLLEGFCCYSANGIYYGNTPLHIKVLNYENLRSFLEKASSENCLPIASVHYGVERLHYPSVEHLRFFHGLADEFTYILHGNHTHSIQGYEKHSDSRLFYSLGNLLFDDVLTTSVGSSIKQNDETRKTYIVKLDISGNEVTKQEVLPIQFDSNGYPKIALNVQEDLLKYSNALIDNYDKISELRNQEIKVEKNKSESRNLSFFIHRLNIKYIGAFINGKIHNKKYKSIYHQYLV